MTQRQEALQNTARFLADTMKKTLFYSPINHTQSKKSKAEAQQMIWVMFISHGFAPVQIISLWGIITALTYQSSKLEKEHIGSKWCANSHLLLTSHTGLQGNFHEMWFIKGANHRLLSMNHAQLQMIKHNNLSTKRQRVNAISSC